MPQFRTLSLNLVYFLNFLLLFLLVFEEKVQVPVFLQVAGRMHPLLLHFPIALLFIGLFIEWFIARKQPHNESLKDVTFFIFNLLAVFAALTALFGFFLYKEGGYQGEAVNWHKWTGVLVSLLAGLLIWMKEKARAFYFPTLIISAVAITITGHLGAELTHGEGFLTEPYRKQSQNRIALIDNPDSAIVFRDVIQPILNEKCSSCHNSNKAKGELILTAYSSLVKGGENKDCLVPGNAAKSLLYKYALLPMEDSLHMPPKGKQQLDKDEITLIGWWINNGAKEKEKYVNLPKPDSIQPIMASLFKPKTGLDLLEIAFADQEKIKALNNPYRTVQQLSASKPYIAVFTGSRNNFSSNDLAELKDLREQVVSIDLGNANLKNTDLETLTRFPHLQKLHLQNNPISDEGIRHLSDLSYLESINLSGTKITSQTLNTLSGLKGLKKIFLYNTGVSGEQIAVMKNKNPSLEVYSTNFDLSDTIYKADLSTPQCKIDSAFFHRQARIEIKLGRGKVRYYYTLDGSAPSLSSTLYTAPFQIDTSAQLKIMAAMEGWKDSPVATYSLLKIGPKPDKVTLETKPDTKQKLPLDSMLVDGKSGSLYRYDKEYMNFLAEDLRANFTYIKPRSLSGITLSYLEDVENGIMPPQYLEVWGGTGKGDLKKLGMVKVDNYPEAVRPAARYVLMVKFPKQPVSYVRLLAKNNSTFPDWHSLRKGKDAKPKILVDEVSLE
jgi:uncharacterized membrane protein